MSEGREVFQFHDYNALVLRDIVRGLVENHDSFPDNFNHKRKLKFLNEINNYLLESQEYELCNDIQTVIRRIKDEYSNRNQETQSK